MIDDEWNGLTPIEKCNHDFERYTQELDIISQANDKHGVWDNTVSFERPYEWELPKVGTHNGNRYYWKIPKRLFHVAHSADVETIFNEGLLKRGYGIYLYNEKVPLNEMTGSREHSYLTVLEVSLHGVKQLIADKDWLINGRWHKENSDKYPQYQYRCRQEKIDRMFLRVVHHRKI